MTTAGLRTTTTGQMVTASAVAEAGQHVGGEGM